MFCLSLGKKARLWGWFASRTTGQETFRNQPVPISSTLPADSGNFSITDLDFLNSRPSSPKALVLGLAWERDMVSAFKTPKVGWGF